MKRKSQSKDSPSGVPHTGPDESLEALKQELQRTQSQLTSLIDSLPFGFFMLGNDGKYVMQNSYMRERWGDIIGKRPQDVAPDKQTLDLWKDNNRKAFSGQTVTGNISFDVKGQKRFFRNIISPVRQQDKVTGVLGVNVDITELEEARRELAESEAKWRSIMESSPDHMMVFDLEGTILSINRTVPELTVEGVAGTSVYDYILDEYKAGVTRCLNHVKETGQTDTYETEYTAADGIPRSFESYVGAIIQGGKTVGFTVRATDISDRKEMEQHLEELVEQRTSQLREVNKELADEISERKKTELRLREAFEKHNAMLNATTDLLMMTDTNYRFLELNDRAVERFGVTRKQLVGKCIWDFVPEHLKEPRKAAVDQVTQTGEHCEWEDESRGVIFHNSAYPLKDNTGEVTGAVVYARDVTERRKLEQQVDAYRDRITELAKNAYVDSMATAVAHELNQPLTVINMLLAECRDELAENTPLRDKIDECLAESHRAADSMKRLRSYAHQTRAPGTGRGNVGQIIEEIVSNMREKATRSNLSIAVETDLPDQMQFDESPLQQILFIMIQNAIDACDDGQEHKLTIRATTSKDIIQLALADDCSGIAPENLDKIFEPFFSTKKDGKGLGLGLEIAHRITVQYGGDIRVESELGTGSTFYVDLPVATD